MKISKKTKKRIRKRPKKDSRLAGLSELVLRDIYSANNQKAQAYLSKAMFEESKKAERYAVMRTARKFSHLLSPAVRSILKGKSITVISFSGCPALFFGVKNFPQKLYGAQHG